MDVDLAEALYRTRRLQPGQLQAVALALLESGHCGPAILELAEFPYATWRDVGNLLDRAFQEADRPPLSEREASMRVARHIAARIAAGAMDPIKGAGELSLIWNDHAEADELAVFASALDEYDYPEWREEARRTIMRAADDLARS
jgi:hypothetical protein